MAKIYKINPEKFALACVQSSASNLKVVDKLGLYKAAYDEAKKLKDSLMPRLRNRRKNHLKKPAKKYKSFSTLN